MNKMILLIIFIFLVSLSLSLSCSGKVKNKEELLNLLLQTDTKEGRMAILSDNKDIITRNMVEEFLKSSFYYTLASYYGVTFKESQKKQDIAFEMAEILSDNELKGIVMLYRAIAMADSPDKAIRFCDKAMEYFKKAKSLEGEAWTYDAMSELFIYLDAPEKRLNLEKAVEIYRKIGDLLNEADCLLHLSNSYYFIGKKEEYLKCKNRIREIYFKLYSGRGKYGEYRLLPFTKTSAKASEDSYKEDIKDTENYIKIIESFTEEDMRLMNEDRDKQNHWPKSPLIKDTKEFLVAWKYRHLAYIYENNGEFERALLNYKKALEICRTKREQHNPDVSKKNIIAEIIFYEDIANIYLIMGKKKDALEYYKKVIEFSRTEHFTKDLLLDYIRFGEALLFNGMADEALSIFTEGLNLINDADMTSSRSFLMKTQFLYNLAIVCFLKGDLKKSRVYLEDSIKISENTDSPWKNKQTLYKLMSEIYLAEGEPQKAIDCISEHRSSLWREFDFLLLSKSYLKLGDKKKSLEYARKALLELKREKYIMVWEFKVFNFVMPTWKSYMEAGKLFESLGDYDNAFEAYKSSINIIEDNMSHLKIEEYKRNFMKDKIEVYECMVKFLIKRGRYEDAFNYNEKARARAFLDILSNIKIDNTENVNSQLIKKIDELEEKIRFYSKEKQNDEKLSQFKREYEKLLEELKLENPEYASLKTVSPLSLEEIRKLITDDTIMFEYFTAENALILWVITKDNILCKNIPIGLRELNGKVNILRKEISSDITLEKINSNEWKSMSKELYGLLIGDCEGLLKNKTRLVIVPHRVLHYIPFQILLDGKGKSLAEKYEIVYLPSGSTMNYCKHKNTMKKEHLVAFEYGNLNRPPYPPLPNTIDEVNTIRHFYPENEVYKANEINKGNIKNKCNNADLLHFATHGILDSEFPMFSKLIFSEDIELHNIFKMKLQAYLVTLSACRTGLGEISEGDEFTGFSRAFIYAGTPTVCVSLWDVSDKSTAELMEKFYFYLKNNNKSRALKLAQIDMMAKYPHPFFWAPFVLIGDWN